MFGGYDEFEFGLQPNPNRGFSETYRCYLVVMMQGNERQNVNFGGKIILPPSALVKLASLNISYPMLFELRNAEKQRHSHAGVLEFIAEEGRVYLPHWMMQTLLLEPGDLLEVRNANLPLGNFVKIQPQSVDFLDISDPKAVLENALRNFSTLTQGDIIQISYNDKTYEILVLEVRPRNNGISIVETDLEVDFAPPVGYVEPKPTKKPKATMKITADEVSNGFAAFQGSGQRLNGKVVKLPTPNEERINGIVKTDQGRLIPAALNLPFGKLYFGYDIKPLGGEKPRKAETVFAGKGQLLKPAKKNRSTSVSPVPPAAGGPPKATVDVSSTAVTSSVSSPSPSLSSSPPSS